MLSDRGVLGFTLLAAFVIAPIALSRFPHNGHPEKTLSLIALQKRVGLEQLNSGLFFIASVMWLLAFTSLFVGLLATIWLVISTKIPTSSDVIWDWRFTSICLAALTATLGAVVALPFTLVRLTYVRRQTETATQALFNDKINAAVTDLHAQRQITKWDEGGKAQNGWDDDITRRNGAIDRLLGLAKEEPESAPRVARMLSVYVKELSREYPAKKLPQANDPSAIKEWARKLTFARSDMQNAVQVLGKLCKKSRQPLDGGKIDLSETNLQGFDLSSLNFENVSFKAAQLQGADLWQTQLQEAELWQSQLQGAYLIGAQFQGADLGHAELQKADLEHAQLQGADLEQAHFDAETTLRGARFSYAGLRGVDFSKTSISQEQLESAFGDASVTLPDGKGPNDPEWPEHWSKEKLDYEEFETKWRALQKMGGFDPDNPN
jgi:uncharacterized protein YjbI with pentapeptide repeats